MIGGRQAEQRKGKMEGTTKYEKEIGKLEEVPLMNHRNSDCDDPRKEGRLNE